MEPEHVAANVQRFTGFAETYDIFRPYPPAVLRSVLTQLAGGERPRLVVDLGSGTGISTRFWAEHAGEVIGIEPSADMRRRAEEVTRGRPAYGNLRYQEGLGIRTRLPEACADIVTCSQSFHWMEPEPTLAEVSRILRPGGLFAAFDCDWPPTCEWEAELAYLEFVERAESLGRARNTSPGLHKWDKEGHLAQMARSGHFRYTKEIVLHNVEEGNADRLVGLALSQGGVAQALQAGLSEQAVGLDRFRLIVGRTLGPTPRPFYFSYRVRLGVK